MLRLMARGQYGGGFRSDEDGGGIKMNVAATLKTNSLLPDFPIRTVVSPNGRGRFFETHKPYDDPYLERLYRLQRHAGSMRIFAKHGLEYSFGGHMAVRDPVLTDHFWLNPVNLPYSHVRVSDLVLVRPDGTLVDETKQINESAFRFHAPVIEARQDVVASAHTHGGAAQIWATLGRLLDPLTQDGTAFFEDHVLLDARKFLKDEVAKGDKKTEMGAPPRQLSYYDREIARVLGPHKAVIMMNHGGLTVGQSVESAAWFTIALDDAADCQLRAEAAGKPIPMPEADARHYAKIVGSEKSGWLFFQILWDQIVREQPDLLD
jgi:ribulose-5-phosphate 4-epimerase/fuculose-1-phosphate aldolase